MRRPVVFSAPATKRMETEPPPAPTVETPPAPSQETEKMDEHFAENLRKAARVGMADYASASDWASGLDHLARKAAKPGQTFEQSYLAVAESPDGAAIYKMMQTAADSEMAGIAKRRSAAGRPTARSPVEVVGDASEQMLAKMAEQRAAQDGTSFEVAYTRVVETAEGAALFKAAMAR